MKKQQSKVVIIESDENQRYLYTIALEFQKLSVLTAATIAEGLEQIKKVHPDLILVDEAVEDFHKFNLIEELETHVHDKIPAIIITNLRDEVSREVEQSQIITAIRYLVKGERTVGNIIRASRKAIDL